MSISTNWRHWPTRHTFLFTQPTCLLKTQPTCFNRHAPTDMTQSIECRIVSFYNFKISSMLYKWHIDPTECQCQPTLILTISTTWNADQSEIGPTEESTIFLQLNQCSVNKEARYLTQNKQLHNVTSHDASKFLIRSRDRVDEMVVDQLSRVDGGRPDQSGRWPNVLVGGLVDRTGQWLGRHDESVDGLQ